MLIYFLSLKNLGRPKSGRVTTGPPPQILEELSLSPHNLTLAPPPFRSVALAPVFPTVSYQLITHRFSSNFSFHTISHSLHILWGIFCHFPFSPAFKFIAFRSSIWGTCCNCYFSCNSTNLYSRAFPWMLSVYFFIFLYPFYMFFHLHSLLICIRIAAYLPGNSFGFKIHSPLD